MSQNWKIKELFNFLLNYIKSRPFQCFFLQAMLVCQLNTEKSTKNASKISAKLTFPSAHKKETRVGHYIPKSRLNPRFRREQRCLTASEYFPELKN
jgi:hypothetical protein